MGLSVIPESLENTLNKLVELRRQREKRDYFAYSQVFLDAAKTLETRFGSWVDSELKDLIAQTDLLLSVSDGQAREKLGNLKGELVDIQKRKFPEANKNLKVFITKLKQKQFTRTSDVIHSISDEVGPSVSIIARLNLMRSDIDSLADMTLSVSGSVEEITPDEKRDLDQSQEDLAAGRVRKSTDPDEIVDYLRSSAAE